MCYKKLLGYFIVGFLVCGLPSLLLFLALCFTVWEILPFLTIIIRISITIGFIGGLYSLIYGIVEQNN